LSMAPLGLAGFFGLCWLWRKDPLERARRIQALTVKAYRFQHDWLRFTHITNFNHRWLIEGIPEGPCVVIANHPTLMDITSISAVLGGGCTIVKPQMFRRPLLHPLIVGAGHIEGPSADVITIGKVVENAVERLKSGFRVIIFPEGTRSKESEMLPFGRTAFEIACRAGVPLVSLTIQCNPVYLSKEVLVYRPPHPTPQLRLGLLSVDDPAAVNHDSRELRKVVQDRYKTWWNQTQLGSDCPPSNP
jgi:1-acyl-sn-glycerol-3-phosphate acyltransferase